MSMHGTLEDEDCASLARMPHVVIIEGICINSSQVSALPSESRGKLWVEELCAEVLHIASMKICTRNQGYAAVFIGQVCSQLVAKHLIIWTSS
jgi:hypothetical protein